jgi:hypothetical protein
MDHESIRNKLSAYLDGAVTPVEKAQIEKHLAECDACRESFQELEKTVRHLRNLGELEPPPWLSARIMARVRAEAGREKGLLRRLLQVPLRWRISVEAVALVFLSVTGYLVYRNVSTELPQIAPLSGVTREEPAPAVPPATTSRNLPEVKHAPGVVKPPAAVTEKPGEGVAPLALPEEEPFAESRQEELEPPVPSPAETPYRSEDKGFTDFRMQERSAAKSLAPADEFSLAEKESRAPSGMARSKALPASEEEMVRVALQVANVAAAQREIERATVRYGGVILRRDFPAEGEVAFLVRLRQNVVRGYLDLLKKLGNLQGPAAAAPEGEDSVDLYLVVTADHR